MGMIWGSGGVHDGWGGGFMDVEVGKPGMDDMSISGVERGWLRSVERGG